ncbi:hypothetical protein [Variovorax sp. LT1R16]|uniref:hypothetical protein n=1 Tax=Variovorax sp. LT1R16 TaxID=3443728 RepID=UPI003F463636
MELRDLALSVRELPEQRYGWVILQGTGEKKMFAHYAVLSSAERDYDSYGGALLAGFVALRALGGRDGPRGVAAAVG